MFPGTIISGYASVYVGGAPAARVSDINDHGAVLCEGSTTVLIEGLPAVRLGDRLVCPSSTGGMPHLTGRVVFGNATVLIGGMPAARVGDPTACQGTGGNA